MCRGEAVVEYFPPRGFWTYESDGGRTVSPPAREVGIVLLIRVVSFRERPVGRELAARFGEAGGTIGRGETSTLVLPDPERISRAPTPVLPTGILS